MNENSERSDFDAKIDCPICRGTKWEHSDWQWADCMEKFRKKLEEAMALVAETIQ